jgi:N-acetylglucosamine-6-phosphate deacetylase
VSVSPDESDGPWLAAGLVDLQVNGYGGLDLNDGRLEVGTVADLCRRLADEAVTRFLPTVITASEPAIVQRLQAISEAARKDPLSGRMIAGVHVEGPFISALDGPRGAHPLADVRPADADEIARWQEAAEGRIRIVTLGAESPGAVAAIRAAAAMGITVALGHSAATPDEIRAAVDAGATMSTHLGNGIAAMLPRHPNPIWTQLAEDRLTASFICDGHHLPFDTAKAMIRAKGPGRAVLVSDAVALAGMPPGRYETAVGGPVEVNAEGRISLAGTAFLAGAGHSLRVMVARAVSHAGVALDRALAMASTDAARVAGLARCLEPGARADLIRFDFAPGDDTLTLHEVVIGGERIAP